MKNSGPVPILFILSAISGFNVNDSVETKSPIRQEYN